MKMVIRDGMGRPMLKKQYNTFDNNYELDPADKAVAVLTVFLLLLGIVYAAFGG